MLRWWVGNFHVSTPLWEIGQKLRKKGRKGFDRAHMARLIVKGRNIHRENRDVYRHVTGGIS